MIYHDQGAVPVFRDLFHGNFGEAALPLPTQAVFAIPRGGYTALGFLVAIALVAKDFRVQAGPAGTANLATALALIAVIFVVCMAMFLPLTTILRSIG
jgi:hypothetical protein